MATKLATAAAEPSKDVVGVVADEVWDQRLTLRPPPYKGAMARLLDGVDIGDDVMDALPDAVVCPCIKHRGASSEMDGLEQLPEPPWVDWDLVRAGQALWAENLGRAFLALTAALLQGFTIARFAEVLNHAGYAKTPMTSCTRYAATAFFLFDWFHFPLHDPDSRARKGIYTVRCMHSYARRRSQALFSPEKGEGIALSQYDLGEVQLGFSAVCMSIMETELGMGALPREDKRAMVHMWRIIGWHLGIQDRFNVCSSLEDLEACFQDYMHWTPQRLRSCRESTHILQRSAVQGFGRHYFLGERYWEGFLAVLETARGMEIRYTRVKALPGMAEFVRMRFNVVGRSARVNRFLSRFVGMMREWRRSRPQLADWVERHLAPKVAFMHDVFIWRVFSLVYSMVAGGKGSLLAGRALAALLLLFALASSRHGRLRALVGAGNVTALAKR